MVPKGPRCLAGGTPGALGEPQGNWGTIGDRERLMVAYGQERNRRTTLISEPLSGPNGNDRELLVSSSSRGTGN